MPAAIRAKGAPRANPKTRRPVAPASHLMLHPHEKKRNKIGPQLKAKSAANR